MKKMKKILAENWKFIVCVLLIAAVLFPMIYTIFYTLPSADDFSMAYGCSRDTILMDSVNHANKRYTSSSGLWIYMFAETLLNPMVYFTLVYNQNISKLPWSRTVAGIKEVKETHDFWQEELIAIRDSEERNMVLEVEPKYMQSDILSLPRLSGNIENWINVRIA